MFRSSPFRSTLNTGYITALDMCEVCNEAVHSVAPWTRVTSQLWTSVKYEPPSDTFVHISTTLTRFYVSRTILRLHFRGAWFGNSTTFPRLYLWHPANSTTLTRAPNQPGAKNMGTFQSFPGSWKNGTNPHHQPTAIDPWMHQPIQGVVAMDVEAFCSTIAEMHDVKEQAIYLAQSLGLDFFFGFFTKLEKNLEIFRLGLKQESLLLMGQESGINSPVEIGSLSHYLQGFMHPKWLFGISEPSTAPLRIQPGFLVRVILHVYTKWFRNFQSGRAFWGKCHQNFTCFVGGFASFTSQFLSTKTGKVIYKGWFILKYPFFQCLKCTQTYIYIQKIYTHTWNPKANHL